MSDVADEIERQYRASNRTESLRALTEITRRCLEIMEGLVAGAEADLGDVAPERLHNIERPLRVVKGGKTDAS